MREGAAAPPLASVVIVNWNGKHLLAECLDSLSRQRFKDFETIVVDNGSTDGSVAFLRRTYPWVRVVSLAANTGFSGGSNAGIRAASGRYIALLNNDTRTDAEWLSSLVARAEKSPAEGMWASKILSYDKPDLFDNVGLLLYPDGLARGKGRLERDEGQYDEPGEALFPSGCAGLFRRSMLDAIGLFDEAFFAYADDVDIGLRARLAGWGCSYVPSAVVHHRYSASSATYSPLKAFLVERNRVWVLLKYFPIELILASPFFTAKRLVLQLYGAITGRGSSGRFSADQGVSSAILILLKAWFRALVALPQVMRERRRIASIRRIRRREFYRLLRMFRISAAELALKD